MILLLSEETDESTSEVMDWLEFYKQKTLRINSTDPIKILDVSLDSFIIEIAGFKVDYKNITAFWYRRGPFCISIPTKTFSLFPEIKNHFLSEHETIVEIIYDLLEKKRHIGSYDNVHLNKIKVLNYANEVGLNIPQTIITTRKSELLNFYLVNSKSIISKSIGNALFLNNDGKMHMIYTEIIDEQVLSKIPDSFQPSLFQENIQKRYEIRSFYINKKFYSMAIFSQSDNQTQTDFRKYNWIFPNRTVPYILPTDIESKMEKIFKKLRLNTGSVDLILNETGKFYFLEINSVGQFGMVSHPCNYKLEKIIAKNLMK